VVGKRKLKGVGLVDGIDHAPGAIVDCAVRDTMRKHDVIHSASGKSPKSRIQTKGRMDGTIQHIYGRRRRECLADLRLDHSVKVNEGAGTHPVRPPSVDLSQRAEDLV